jgi:hypothetical protein
MQERREAELKARARVDRLASESIEGCRAALSKGGSV